MITNNIAVPEDKAPNKSVAAARKPIAAPPITVKGIIYLSNTLSKTLTSCLNPEICKPDACIFCACSFAPIPEVLTQNTENKVASPV